MPVQLDTMSAMSSAVTVVMSRPLSVFQELSSASSFWRSTSSLSRRFGGLLEVLALDRLFLLPADAVGLFERLAHLLRQEARLQPDLARRLVHQVDRLVRQEPVRDVPVGERRRGDKRLVADLDAVVRLVPLPQPAQDLDTLLHGRLRHEDRGEAALERGVALDVLPVLVERGRADALQLAAGQRRLEDVARVDRALRRAGADERVQLVDEEDDLAPRLADLLHHLLHALFELAAVLGAGDEGRQVELHHPLVPEDLGDVPADDPLGQALGDRGLADARLADQGRIVLGAAGEHLDDALDLAVAPDHGVQLAVARVLREVPPELVERGGLARLLGGGGGASFPEQGDDQRADALEIGARRFEHAGGDAVALADQAEQEVFGADVVVREAPSFVQRELEDPLGPGRERDFLVRRTLAAPDGALDLRPDALEVDVQGLQHLAGDPFAVANDPEEEVLGADRAVVEALRFLLGEDDHTTGTFRESFKHLEGRPLSATHSSDLSIAWTSLMIPSAVSPWRLHPVTRGALDTPRTATRRLRMTPRASGAPGASRPAASCPRESGCASGRWPPAPVRPPGCAVRSAPAWRVPWRAAARLDHRESKRINRTGRRGLRGARQRRQDTPSTQSPRQQSRPITCAPAATSSAGGAYASTPRRLRAWSPWPWKLPSSEPPSCGLISYRWSLPGSPLSGPASAPGECPAELARPVGPGAGQLLRLAGPDPLPVHPPSLLISVHLRTCTHALRFQQPVYVPSRDQPNAGDMVAERKEREVISVYACPNREANAAWHLICPNPGPCLV